MAMSLLHTCASLLAGLLANLTCIQAELYEMQEAMSVGESPLWVIPYATVDANYQQLLNDVVTYMTVTPPVTASVAL